MLRLILPRLWALALVASIHSNCLAAEPRVQPPALEIEYAAPAGCGTRQDVLALLDDALGPNSASRGWSAAVKVTRLDDTTLSVHFEATRAELHTLRRLQVDSCRAAVEVTSFLLLLAIDPLRAAEVGVLPPLKASPPPAEQEPPPKPEISTKATSQPTAPTKPKPEPKAKPKPKAPPPRKTKPRPNVPEKSLLSGSSLTAAGVWNTGEGASSGFGVGLELSKRWRPLYFSLGASWLAPSEVSISGAEGAQFTTTALGAGVQAGALWGVKSVQFGPYLGAGIRRVEAVATGISAPLPASSTSWPSLGGGVMAIAQATDSIGFIARFGGVHPLSRPAFRVVGVGIAHRPQALAFDALLGISWRYTSQ